MVDLKLALYTKTWTWMNWLAIVVFSIVIYIGFVWLGDMLTFFNSYKTARMTFNSAHFYLLVVLSSTLIYVFDMTLLILMKEVYTPLSMFFSSIMRRKLEDKDLIFEKIVESFQKKDLVAIKNRKKKNKYEPGGNLMTTERGDLDDPQTTDR
jgi:hypothetical protein